jgi:hypothetical protein
MEFSLVFINLHVKLRSHGSVTEPASINCNKNTKNYADKNKRTKKKKSKLTRVI